MYNENLIANARSITESLISKGVRVVPKSVELNNAVNAALYTVSSHSNISDNTGVEELKNLFETQLLGAGTLDGVKEFTDYLTAIAKENLKLTRKFALPLIQQLTTALEHNITQSDLDAKDNSGINIVQYNGADILESSDFNNGSQTDTLLSLVEEFAIARFNTAPPRPKYISNPLTIKEIEPYLLTGIASLDEAIKAYYINGNPDNTCKWINSMFAQVEAGNPDSSDLDGSDHTLEPIVGGVVIVNIVGFLFASGISRDNVPDGVNLSLDKYTTDIAQYKVYLGRQVYDALTKLENSRRGGYMKLNEYQGADGLVIEISKDSFSRLLYSTEYPDISIETFIGCALSDSPEWFEEEFVNNVALYNKVYEDHKAARLERSMGARALSVRTTLVNYGEKLFADRGVIAVEVDGSEPLQLNYTGDKLSGLNEFINGQLNTYYPNLMSNGELLNDTCLTLARVVICDFVFEGTMVGEIVKRMMVITKGAPDVNTNHAGMLSVISILIDTLLSQVEFQMDFSSASKIDKRTHSFCL